MARSILIFLCLSFAYPAVAGPVSDLCATAVARALNPKPLDELELSAHREYLYHLAEKIRKSKKLQIGARFFDSANSFLGYRSAERYLSVPGSSNGIFGLAATLGETEMLAASITGREDIARFIHDTESLIPRLIKSGEVFPDSSREPTTTHETVPVVAGAMICASMLLAILPACAHDWFAIEPLLPKEKLDLIRFATALVAVGIRHYFLVQENVVLHQYQEALNRIKDSLPSPRDDEFVFLHLPVETETVSQIFNLVYYVEGGIPTLSVYFRAISNE